VKPPRPAPLRPPLLPPPDNAACVTLFGCKQLADSLGHVRSSRSTRLQQQSQEHFAMAVKSAHLSARPCKEGLQRPQVSLQGHKRVREGLPAGDQQPPQSRCACSCWATQARYQVAVLKESCHIFVKRFPLHLHACVGWWISRSAPLSASCNASTCPSC
jgi:hypothetical protein